jgi:hypothetical protein
MAVALLAIAGIAWFGSRSAPDAPSDTAVVASDTTAAATAETTTTTIAETTTEPVETTTTVAETTTSSAEETTTSTIEETTTSAAEPPEPVFGSGTFVVGDDVAPGVYETGDIGSGLFGGCSWERLDSDGEVIASHDAVGHAVVEIKDTDAAFDSDCDEWFELTPLDEPLAAIPDGTWVVGVHIFPDTYTTGGGRRCGFERLAGAGRDPADVLSSEEPDGETTVEILDTDYAFSTAGCDHWMS